MQNKAFSQVVSDNVEQSFVIKYPQIYLILHCNLSKANSLLSVISHAFCCALNYSTYFVMFIFGEQSGERRMKMIVDSEMSAGKEKKKKT